MRFTTWKWVVTALFGIVPLLAFLAFLLGRYALLPLSRAVKKRSGRGSTTEAVQEPESKRIDEPPPPPYQPRDGASDP